MSAWGGISSVQLGLPLFWTEGRRRGFGLADVNRLMACNTARLAGLDNRDRDCKVAWGTVSEESVTQILETSQNAHMESYTV